MGSSPTTTRCWSTSTPDSSPGAIATAPENLDRAAIAAGLATISMKRCNGASSATGLVKAQLKVSAAGAVTSVTVQSSPDPALSACVAEQAKQGRFKPTRRGASFSYVWRF
jgi:outer membrane biosynthesis protein TonB